MKEIYCKVFLDCSYPLIIPFPDLQEYLENEFIEAAGVDDIERYKIEFILLTDEEYNELEEHTGW